MLWLYLHFPMLQLDTLYIQHHTQPIVIVDPVQHQIVQVNQIALEHGINLTMNLATAASLCPDLQVIPYNPEIEQHALQALAQRLYLITADIVLFPPKGLLLKVNHMLSLYQNLENYWHNIKQHIDHHPDRYDYATGISPLSAKLLAEQRWNTLSDDRKLILNTVSEQPISATALTENQIQHLQRIGIRYIKELQQLPMQELARQFDIELVNYMGRLLGQFKHPCQYFLPPEHFQSEIDLLYEIENTQWLEKPITRLYQQLEPFLRLRNQVAFDIQLVLWQKMNHTDILDNEKKQTLQIQAAQGEYRANNWLALTRLKLESVSLAGPIYRISLEVTRSGMEQTNTHDFWDGTTGNMENLELISLLQAKLGKDKLHKLSLTDDPRPEKSTQLIDAIAYGYPSSRTAQLRPSLLLPSPQPLTESVSLLQGPERIMTGWWDDQPITRDYFIARSTTGRWLWIFRDTQSHWFLHGLFS